MQYHQDGFRPGDPAVSPAADVAPRDPGACDVLIVGTGPTGLVLAAQLARFPEIDTRIIERRAGPLVVGQADGIACRTMEMFAAFGFAHRVMHEAYFVNEVCFWRPDGAGRIHRADRIDDVEPDLSEMPHVILSQARVHDFLLEAMGNAPARLAPEYGLTLTALVRDDHPTHPLRATLSQAGGGERVLRARYVVGCDGAHSTVRREMGLALEGAGARQLWGVMDILAVTDFPDIRLKCAIQSAGAGSLLIIPREGGFMVRMYIELDALAPGERPADRRLSPDVLIAKARAILAPYSLEVAEVAWWSAYEIGQRLCARFDDADPGAGRDPRIFIAGDAGHTHSPKAGQGMNVSMADAFNLGWKLAAVLRGQAGPGLLASYSAERQAQAEELIAFDRDMARLFSEGARNPARAAEFEAYFRRHGRYTAGVETRYGPSAIIGDGTHQALAAGLPVGMRFHSAPVVRLADARPMQLGHAFEADGRWRIVAFAPRGDDGAPGGAVARLCAALTSAKGGALHRFTPAGAADDAVLDLRAVFHTPHRELDLAAMPAALKPRKGRLALVDYEKIFTRDPAPGRDIYALRGIDAERGAVVIVRPDQFVAAILPIDDAVGIAAFLEGAHLRPARP